MNEPKPNKKFAVSNGPVNRRLIPPLAPAREQAAPAALARVQLAKAKHRLGASLAERLSGVQSRAATPSKLSSGDILTVVGGAISAVGVTLGLIQGSMLIAGVGGVFLCGIGLRAHLAAKSKRQTAGNPAVEIGDFIDAKDIAKLDADMEKVAADADQDTVDRLAAIKERLSRCVAMIASANDGQTGGALANDDQLFIRECVRRYLPDSLASYLKVPSKDRASMVIDEGKTALSLLHEQIDMLKSKLEGKEARLVQESGEALMRQQRFLSVKTKT